MSSAVTPVELSRRLTRVGIAYTIARMKVIEARSGQPVEVRRFGDAAALMARQVPSPHFNAVVGLRGGQENLVGELDDWYRANDIKGRFVVAPGDLSAELGRALAARGYAQTDFDTVLYAAPPPAAARRHAVRDRRGRFTWRHGRVPRRAAVRLGRSAPSTMRAPRRTCAAGSTCRLPPLPHPDRRPSGRRRRNCFSTTASAISPTPRPIRISAAADCRPRCCVTAAPSRRNRARELIYSQAAFGSVSHRNMERVGLRVLCTRSIWTR